MSSVRVHGGASVRTKNATNPATQAEVDAGTATNKYVSPKTLNDWSGGGGGGTWGSITGTLSAQTDLQAALDAKWSVTGMTTLTGAVTIAQGGFNTDFSGTGKVTFSPSATLAGLNIGSYAGTPSGADNADFWYHPTFHVPLMRINSITSYILNNAEGLTANRILYATGTNLGSVGNSANLTYNGTTLTLKGAGTTTGTAFLVEDSAGTDRLTVLDSGEVGINGRPVNGEFVKLSVFGTTNSESVKNTAFKNSGGTNLWTITNAGGLRGEISSSYLVIGSSSVTTSVILDVQSTTKAFAPPRMTEAQRDAIGTPSAGMVVYNTTTNVLNFYNGSAWGAV